MEDISPYWRFQPLLEVPAPTEGSSPCWRFQPLLEVPAPTGGPSPYWRFQPLLEVPAPTGVSSPYWRLWRRKEENVDGEEMRTATAATKATSPEAMGDRHHRDRPDAKRKF